VGTGKNVEAICSVFERRCTCFDAEHLLPLDRAALDALCTELGVQRLTIGTAGWLNILDKIEPEV
jgi:hypothetical protein